jgi:hypothetical protein
MKPKEKPKEEKPKEVCSFCGDDHHINQCTLYIILISSGC